jgi:hypothetical protein
MTYQEYFQSLGMSLQDLSRQQLIAELVSRGDRRLIEDVIARTKNSF